MLLTLLLATQGPISKWDERKVAYDYVSSANLYDAERCLSDMRGHTLAVAHRQPDRPDEVTLMFLAPEGQTNGRIDLRRATDGLRVRSWLGSKQVQSCTPPK